MKSHSNTVLGPAELIVFGSQDATDHITALLGDLTLKFIPEQ
jgi:hypothetical protein